MVYHHHHSISIAPITARALGALHSALVKIKVLLGNTVALQYHF